MALCRVEFSCPLSVMLTKVMSLQVTNPHALPLSSRSPCLSQNNIWARRELRNDPSRGFHAGLCGAVLALQRDVSALEEGPTGGPAGWSHQARAWHHLSQFLFSLFHTLGKDHLTKICTATITATKRLRLSGLVSLVRCIDEDKGRLVLCPQLLLFSHRLCP